MRWSIAVGILWGIFCGIANGWPIATTLVQMAVPWVWVAAFVGLRFADSTKNAALLGGLALLAANLTYFTVGAVSSAVSGGPPVISTTFLAIWGSIGLIIGPISGVLGRWLRGQRTAVAAATTLATLSVAEPLAQWAHIDHLGAHVAYVGVAIVGLVFPFYLFRGEWRKGIKAAASAVVLTYPTAVILEATLIALAQISPPMRLI